LLLFIVIFAAKFSPLYEKTTYLYHVFRMEKMTKVFSEKEFFDLRKFRTFAAEE